MKYYMCDESEYVFPLAFFKTQLIEEGEEQIKLFEVKRQYGDGNMWCHRAECIVKKGDCGKDCESYQPCNGKSGRCRNLENGFMKTGKELILTESGLEEVKRICGLCTEYDSDNSYCPHRGEMFEEDTCDGFQSEEELEAAKADAAERENHRKDVEGEIE